MDRKNTKKGLGLALGARLSLAQRRNGQLILCGWREGGQGGWDMGLCEWQWGLWSQEALQGLMIGLQVRDFTPYGLGWSQH